MQTVKKKRIKTAKKPKHHDIVDMTETKDETNTITNQQTFIEHTVASETHVQTIKTVPLENAPEYIESFLFEENTLPMETETGPKSIEILALFHASSTQTASVLEKETRINSKESPTQKCHVNISESTPLVVSEIEKTESVEPKKSIKIVTPIQVSSTLITSNAALSDIVVPFDNLNAFESETMPVQSIAESSSIPFESTTIYEQVASQKETILNKVYAPNLKQAHQSVSAQIPIEIQEIAAGESETAMLDKYEVIPQLATCSLISNTALNTEEIHSQNLSTKFYPETFIATEEATPKYVEQFPYYTQEICSSEIGNPLKLQSIFDKKQAHINFASLHAITTEQTNISESEIISSHEIPTDLMAIAKDTVDLHREIETGFSQTIDTVQPNEPIQYTMKRASISVEEMGGKLVETVNVLQSEKPLELMKPSVEQEAIPKYTPQEVFTISETLLQDSNSEFVAAKPNLAQATKSHELHKTAEQYGEVLIFEASNEYSQKPTDEAFIAKIDFELQKSLIQEANYMHDSEQAFETKLITNIPHYSHESKLNSPLVILDEQVHEMNADLSTEPTIKAEAVLKQEFYKTYQQQAEHIFDTASDYQSNEKILPFNAEINFELQKSSISQSVLAHDSEKVFETKLETNEPRYSFESNVKNPITISEAYAQERDIEFLTKPTPSISVTTKQELFKAPESSKNQLLETVDLYEFKDKKAETSAQVNFEWQKSMTSETVVTHDLEETFETKKQQIQPHYTLTPDIKSSISVCETQIIDSETSLGVKPSDSKHLHVIDSPKQFSYISTVSETLPYDTAELMPTSTEKSVLAKQQPFIHHEIAVELPTVSETLNQLETPKLDKEKMASLSFTHKNALKVTLKESSEALDDFKTIVQKEQYPNSCRETLPAQSIFVHETEILEHSSRFDGDSVNTATAIISTTKHETPHIDINWPMDTLQEFKCEAIVCDQELNQKFVESTAIQTFTVNTAETFEEFEKRPELQVKPKVLVNELRGLVTENIVSQEHADQSQFEMNKETVKGHFIDDIEEQHRCEQLQPSTFESTSSLQSFSGNNLAQSTKNVSHTLTTAKVEEVIASSYATIFEHEQINQQFGRITQDVSTVVGQSVQDVLLESEHRLTENVKDKQAYPIRSIEGLSSYVTNEIETMEREKTISAKDANELLKAKITTEQCLPIADNSINTVFADVEHGISEIQEQPLRMAISKIDKLFEQNVKDIFVHESTSDLIKIETKSSTAKQVIEYEKSVQIERMSVLEKEEQLEPTSSEEKKCETNLQETLKIATSEISQTIEQTNKQPAHKPNSKTAIEIASEIDQATTFESVYLQEQKDLNQSAQMISELPTHGVNVFEQVPLFKEIIFDEKRTNKLFAKPFEMTQEKTELNTANKDSIINTHVNIKTNEKADNFTNKKITKRKIESVQTVEITEGKCCKIVTDFQMISLQQMQI